MKWIWLIGLLILPFWFWPKAAVPFEVPKVWFMYRWVELLWVGGLVHILLGKRWHWPGVRWLWVLAALLLVTVAASWWGVDWHKSVFGNYYRVDGLLTLFHWVGLALWVAFFWQADWQVLTKRVLVGGGIGVAALALLQAGLVWLGWLPSSGWEGNSVGATFGQPNFLAGYLTVLFPLLIEWLRGRRFWFGWLVIFLGGVLVTQAKSAWALIAGYGIVWWLMKKRRRQASRLVSLGGIGLLFGLGVFLLVRQPVDLPDSRLRILARSVMAWQQRPWLGWGFANVDQAIESVTWPMPYLHDVYVDKAHSTFLEYLVTTGVVGLTVYGGLAVIVGWRLRKQTVLLSVFILYLLHAQTNVISINEELIFWWLVGMAGNSNLHVYT